MLNTWKNHFEIPIFNYYESFNNLENMLKEKPKEPLNRANYEYLSEKLFELQDWFAFDLDETKTKSIYKTLTRLINYKYRRHSLEVLLIGLKAYGMDTKTEWLMDEKTLEVFKEKLKPLDIVYQVNIKDQIKEIERKVRGLKNDIGILEKDLAKNQADGSHNYMETVIQVNKIMGFRINIHKYTLHEWSNTLKIINKTPKAKR